MKRFSMLRQKGRSSIDGRRAIIGTAAVALPQDI
jgi:hypothetical protein